MPLLALLISTSAVQLGEIRSMRLVSCASPYAVPPRHGPWPQKPMACEGAATPALSPRRQLVRRRRRLVTASGCFARHSRLLGQPGSAPGASAAIATWRVCSCSLMIWLRVMKRITEPNRGRARAKRVVVSDGASGARGTWRCARVGLCHIPQAPALHAGQPPACSSPGPEKPWQQTRQSPPRKRGSKKSSAPGLH